MNTVPFRTARAVARALARASSHLDDGGLIAYPTDTVYGIGGRADREDAVAALRALKHRDEERPFLLLLADPAHAPALEWTLAARALAAAFWPGPLSIALRAPPGAYPPGIAAADGTVAVRVTAHAGMRALLTRVGAPLTSSSANAPGATPALDADGALRALRELGGQAVLVLDGGPLPASPPSTLVRCVEGDTRVLRAGAIGVAEVRSVLAPAGSQGARDH